MMHQQWIRPWLSGLVAASACALIAACGGGSSQGGASLQSLSSGTGAVQTEAQGLPFEVFSPAIAQTAITEKRLVTVRDAQAWNQLWTEHTGPGFATRPVPPVDFSRNMVVGVFLGSRGACDRVEIASVRQLQEPARIEVAYRDIPPPPDMACIASIVNLAVLATIPRSELPVEFVQVPARPASELVIRSGWEFGLCTNNCKGEVEIAKDGASLQVERQRNASQPKQGLWGQVSAEEWNTLAANFASLPDLVVGCPGCADEGREWLEVEKDGKKKRVTVSCGMPFPDAGTLAGTVRGIRGRLAAALGLPEFCTPGSIAFERLAPTVFTSRIGDRRFVTVRDEGTWNALWREHAGDGSAPPAVNFGEKMVLAVFLGADSVTCGSMQIETVRQNAHPPLITVGYRVTDPGPNVMCIAAQINQYSFVTVPASGLPVEYLKLQ